MRLVIRKVSREAYRKEINEIVLSFGLKPGNVRDDDDPSDCAVCGGAYFLSDGIFELADIDSAQPRCGFVCAKCAFYPPHKIREAWQWRMAENQHRADVTLTVRNKIEEDGDDLEIARNILESELRSLGDSLNRLQSLIECAYLESLSSASEVSTSGYVYLLGSPEGYCKIGRTINLNSRLHSIGLQLPFKVELLHTIKVSDPVKAERFLHLKFKDCRANGEWFLLSVEQINWIKSQVSLEGQF
jgi:hypothetical protein